MTKHSKKSPTKTARSKMMDLIAIRNHSEKELRQKLEPDFAQDEIGQAIDYAKTQSWIPDTLADQNQLSEETAANWHRKSKGIEFINYQLSQKGLPPVESDPAVELEKALGLVKNKYSVKDDLGDDEKAKMEAKLGRFLISRGFDMETVDQVLRKVIYEKF